MKADKSLLKKQLGQRVKAMRKDAGYTQSELADVLQMCRTTYLEKERGYHEFTGSELVMLCKIWPCNPAYLLDGVGMVGRNDAPF